ncbi:MAG: hypothetical protein P3W87_008640 [Gammaproteobacteria bacterium]|nr:hypothetical protein [Gammaproteobacteria bacterium]
MGSHVKPQAGGIQEGNSGLWEYDLKVGLAAFHNDKNPSHGVAALPDGQLRIFESRTSLATDYLWISTAEKAITAQNFRTRHYFRSSLNVLADDLGVLLKDEVKGLPWMARLMNETIQLARRLYRWPHPMQAWSRPTLADVIRAALPRYPEVASNLAKVLENAHQTYSVVPDRDRMAYRDNAMPVQKFTLRHNRLEYAHYLLSQPVPDPSAPWSIVRFKSLKQAIDSERPVLAMVALEFDPPGEDQIDYSRLAAFGSQKFYERRGHLRTWVAQPELAWLAQHAHIHLQTTLVSEASAIALPQAYALPRALTSDPLMSLSLPAGLVAENHWVSLTLPRLRASASTQTGGTTTFESVMDPVGVWLRAYDRAYGFFMAEQAARMKFNVVSYGYGSVSVESEKYDIGKIFDLADALGTVHPNLEALYNRLIAGEDTGAWDAG